MIIFWHWPYRWLCRLGLHEYSAPYRGLGKPFITWTCGVCKRRKRVKSAKQP